LVKKDLSKIGRDLKTSIIVDNVADNFCLQPDNGIFIKTWYDDMTDSCLEDLIPLLRGKKIF
jgi:CTD small phosphatase-like protein 2